MKKEIVFSGDVLNTTARIRSECTKFNKEVLVSRELLSILYLNDSFLLNEIGETELRGKETKIKLYSIEQK